MDESVIPKIIHQTWKSGPETLPEHWKISYDGWKSLDGWEYMYWSDDDIDIFISEHYNWFYDTFKSYAYGIQRADTFRYFVLHKYGGIYSDFDIAPKSNFESFYELVKYEDIVISRNKDGNSVGDQNLTNAFMMSKPGSKFWNHVWTYLKDPFKSHSWKKLAVHFHYFKVLFTTGPGIINDSVKSYDGEVYKIPGMFTQPGDDNTQRPFSTKESVVEVLDGGSWHNNDAVFWKTAGNVYNNSFWICVSLSILFFISTIVFLFLWLKLRRKLKNSIKRSASYNSVWGNVY